ncbi:DUF2849 domain-containing protein [Rhodovibrionaceae bacterium A322]
MSDKKLSISEDRPQVITANRLIDGVVVYFTAGNQWSVHLADAVRDGLPDPAAARLQIASAAAFAEEVVGVYPFEVDGQTGDPLSVRELIRASGPSVQLELNNRPLARP